MTLSGASAGTQSTLLPKSIIPSVLMLFVREILLTLRLSESRMSLLILPSVSKEKPVGLNFVDVDGMRWVDQYGFVVWGTKGPTSFATEMQKELGRTMRQSRTGTTQLQKLVSAPFDVVVNIDEHSLSPAFGKAQYESSSPSSAKKNVKITIFQKSAKRRSAMMSNAISEIEALAINFGHEIEHLTEEAFVLDAEGAPEEEREGAPDKVSEEMTSDYLNKLEKIDLIFRGATTELQHNTIIL